MTDLEAYQLAVEVVAAQAQACLPPTLDQSELEACVRKGQLAASWQPLMPYPQGATVIPTASNGHLYVCTVAGTSGDIEPAWNQFAGTTTTDGTVTWTESGLEHGFYDTNQATFEAWLLKCAKATALVQNSSAGQSQASQQVFQHCRQMASYWEPAHVA
jgi:hypothetical protein